MHSAYTARGMTTHPYVRISPIAGGLSRNKHASESPQHPQTTLKPSRPATNPDGQKL
ncbi:hypothetical protein DSO57_1029364 [Entomophthora muscae]|uniref:Uncharacterized protein n=1 Tax=Entomophthora muscae TaxID=34485 RepID=A0ACC2S3B0_9FUNG|nr:hypothetical protein DSO57_1029364 [Entomophthora muscae]